MPPVDINKPKIRYIDNVGGVYSAVREKSENTVAVFVTSNSKDRKYTLNFDASDVLLLVNTLTLQVGEGGKYDRFILAGYGNIKDENLTVSLPTGGYKKKHFSADYIDDGAEIMRYFDQETLKDGYWYDYLFEGDTTLSSEYNGHSLSVTDGSLTLSGAARLNFEQVSIDNNLSILPSSSSEFPIEIKLNGELNIGGSTTAFEGCKIKTNEGVSLIFDEENSPFYLVNSVKNTKDLFNSDIYYMGYVFTYQKTGEETAFCLLKGDKDFDGVLDQNDATNAAQTIVGISYEDLFFDVNEDGKIDVNDIVLIIKK